MYMDSSQLDVLVDAYRVCVLRLYAKTKTQSEVFAHVSKILFWGGLLWMTASLLFFPQKVAWEAILFLFMSVFIMGRAVKILRSFHIPSPREFVREAHDFTDELPDCVEWEERQACDALTEAIVSDDYVLVKRILADIESSEYMESLRDWSFTALVKKAFA